MIPLFAFGAPRPLPALVPFDPDERGTIEWIQPRRLHSEWCLVCGERTFAVLRGPNSIWRPMRLSVAGGEFELRHSIWKGVTIARASGEVFARVRPHLFAAGPVEIGGEHRYTLCRIGLLGGKWELQSTESIPLVRFGIKRAFLSLGATITFEDAGRRIEELPPLLGLLWYAIITVRRRSK